MSARPRHRLLEDSNGIIDLDLPISASLDDPQFTYGKIIWKAFVNVLTKLVTVPFRGKNASAPAQWKANGSNGSAGASRRATRTCFGLPRRTA